MPSEVQIQPPRNIEAGARLKFQHVRDTELHAGVLRDVLQDGLRFEAAVPVRNGQMLNVWVAHGDGLRGVVRVTGSRPLEREAHGADRYELTGQFVLEGNTLRALDRRRFPRVPADFTLSFRRRADETAYPAQVRDVSPGGLRFISRERPDVNELIVVHLRAGALPEVHHDLASAMLVVDFRSYTLVESPPPVPPDYGPPAPVGKQNVRLARVLKHSDLELERRILRLKPPLYEIRARFVIQ